MRTDRRVEILAGENGPNRDAGLEPYPGQREGFVENLAAMVADDDGTEENALGPETNGSKRVAVPAALLTAVALVGKEAMAARGALAAAKRWRIRRRIDELPVLRGDRHVDPVRATSLKEGAVISVCGARVTHRISRGSCAHLREPSRCGSVTKPRPLLAHGRRRVKCAACDRRDRIAEGSRPAISPASRGSSPKSRRHPAARQGLRIGVEEASERLETGAGAFRRRVPSPGRMPTFREPAKHGRGSPMEFGS